PLVFALGPSVFDRDIAALLIAEVAQALPKWFYEVGLESSRGVSQEPNAVHRSTHLRPRRHAPNERGAQTDKKFPACAHSITSSARASSDCGTVRPSAFAVFRLITSSKLVGRSTGRSAGLAPLRILSTKTAAYRHSARKFGPYAIRERRG